MKQGSHSSRRNRWAFRPFLSGLNTFAHGIRYLLRWLLRLSVVLFLLLTGLFAYLHLHGMPQNVTDLWLEWLAKQGYYLQIERLSLELDRGLTAHQVRLFGSPADAAPLLEAKTFTTTINPWRLLRRREMTPMIAIEEGTIRARLGSTSFETPRHSPLIEISHINTRFSVNNNSLQLSEFQAQILGIAFRGRGRLYFSPREADISTSEFSNPIAAVVHFLLEEAPPIALEIVDKLNQIQFPEPPEADFVFAAYMDHLEQNQISLRFNAPKGIWAMGIAMDQCLMEITWTHGNVTVSNFLLRNGPHQLQLSGTYQLLDQLTTLRLYNTLPLSLFLPHLLPEDAIPFIVSNRIQFDFPLQLHLTLGPAPFPQLLETVEGRLTFSKTGFRDLWMERIDAQFSRKGASIQIPQADVQIGRDIQKSHLKVSEAYFNLLSRRFQAKVQGTLNPYAVHSILTPNQQNLLSWFGFSEAAKGNVTVGGVAGNPAIYVYGPVSIDHFTVQGGGIDRAEGYLNITNEVMSITDAIATRPEGIMRGEGHMAFSNQTLRVKVDSTFDPRVTTQLLGPYVYDFFQPFHLNNPTRVHAQGLFDYCNFSLNDLFLRVDANQLGFDRWVADTAQFDLYIKGRRFSFTNVTGTAYGGRFNAHANLYPVMTDSNWRYEITADAVGAELADAVAASVPRDEPSTLRGRLDGHIQMGGYLGKGRGPEVIGKGHASVRDGHIFQTKLFRGLTSVLNKIIPDFSLFSQTSASGDFTISNSRISSDNIHLGGSVFSVNANGDYYFDNNIDYRVEVQLLRSGPIASIVRLLTKPVTRLLEFRLTGTFDEPRWRMLSILPTDFFTTSTNAPLAEMPLELETLESSP